MPGRTQRGLSLVELLVGIAITLVVVAGALKMFVGHLEGNRRLLLEARLHQDLRAASDLIARDLRRAGYWQQASQGTSWPAQPNPYRAMSPSGTASAALTSYSYSRDAAENNSLDSNESFGLRLERRGAAAARRQRRLAAADRCRHGARHQPRHHAADALDRPRPSVLAGVHERRPGVPATRTCATTTS